MTPAGPLFYSRIPDWPLTISFTKRFVNARCAILLLDGVTCVQYVTRGSRVIHAQRVFRESLASDGR